MIREAVIDDLEALAKLRIELKVYHHDLDPYEYTIPTEEGSKSKIKFYLEHADDKRISRFICHEGNGVIDAYAKYEIFTPYVGGEKIADFDGHISIEEIMVSESSRRKGIGTELIHKLCEIAKENDCTSLYLSTHAENYGAHQFYKKLGLVPKSIRMEKRL